MRPIKTYFIQLSETSSAGLGLALCDLLGRDTTGCTQLRRMIPQERREEEGGAGITPPSAVANLSSFTQSIIFFGVPAPHSDQDRERINQTQV